MACWYSSAVRRCCLAPAGCRGCAGSPGEQVARGITLRARAHVSRRLIHCMLDDVQPLAGERRKRRRQREMRGKWNQKLYRISKVTQRGGAMLLSEYPPLDTTSNLSTVMTLLPRFFTDRLELHFPSGVV